MLFYNTVNELLKSTLFTLMKTKLFDDFRLVGGTALSLQLGHRESVDIDLFSDVSYDNIDFDRIEHYLKSTFAYVDYLSIPKVAFGRSYTIGINKENAIKLDLFYTDSFIWDCEYKDGVRLSSIEEICAMKIDVIQRGGRKKDFWDLHELLNFYSIPKMLDFHKRRYPYNHQKELILKNFIDFSNSDDDFDPICLRGKHWEFIKADFEDEIRNIV